MNTELNRIKILVENGFLELAEKSILGILARDPKNIDAQYLLLSIYEKQGRIIEIIKFLDLIIDKNPDNSAALILRGLFRIRENLEDGLNDILKGRSCSTVPAAVHFCNGIEQLFADNIGEAIIELTFAKEVSNGNPFFSLFLSYVEGKIGKKQKAVDKLSELLKNDNILTGAYFARGSLRAELGDWGGAIDDLTEVIAQSPGHLETYLKRASAYLEKGDYENAIADYERVQELKPELTKEFIHDKNVAQILMNNSQGAILELTNLLTTYPMDEDLLFQRGNVYAEMMDIVSAERDFNTIILHNPQSALGLLGSGIIKCIRRDYQNAIIDLEKGRALKPELEIGRYYLLLAKVELNGDNVIEELNTFIKDFPESQLGYILRLSYYSRKKDFTKAIRDADKLISLQPNHYIGYLQRGMIRSELMDSHADEDFHKAVQIKPDCFFGYLSSLKLQTDEDFYRAMPIVNKAIELATFTRIPLYVYRANLKHELRDYSGALSDVQSAIDLANENKEGLFANLDDLYLMRIEANIDLHNFSNAWNDIETYFKTKTRTAEIEYCVGKLKYEKEEGDKGKAQFEQVVRLNKNHGSSYYYLGKIAFDADRKLTARNYFSKAAELGIRKGTIELQRLGAVRDKAQVLKYKIDDLAKKFVEYCVMKKNDKPSQSELGKYYATQSTWNRVWKSKVFREAVDREFKNRQDELYKMGRESEEVVEALEYRDESYKKKKTTKKSTGEEVEYNLEQTLTEDGSKPLKTGENQKEDKTIDIIDLKVELSKLKRTTLIERIRQKDPDYPDDIINTSSNEELIEILIDYLNP